MAATAREQQEITIKLINALKIIILSSWHALLRPLPQPDLLSLQLILTIPLLLLVRQHSSCTIVLLS
jgi:hypothetical protein